jgi:hypothetical protein
VEEGFVYVLANSAMPDLVKVGFTTRNALDRASELGSPTGVPVPFIVVYQRAVRSCRAAETHLHLLLEQRGYRIAQNREFFSAPASIVIQAILDLPDEYLSESTNLQASGDLENQRPNSPPWADIWNQAVAAHFGLGTEFRDLDKAKQLYKTAAKLGCNLAYYRLGMIEFNAADDEVSMLRAVPICRQGVDRGNYACYLLLAKIYLERAETDNAAKALGHFFSTRDKQLDCSLEDELLVKNALAHILGQASNWKSALEPHALAQLKELKVDLVATLDQLIAEMVDANELPDVIDGYSVTRDEVSLL